MLYQQLVECGLTENEAKVFLAAMELGPSLASTLARKTGINRSTVYAVIQTLKHKGLLSSFEKQGITYFSPADPEVLLQNIIIKLFQLFHCMFPVPFSLKGGCFPIAPELISKIRTFIQLHQFFCKRNGIFGFKD